MFLIYFCDNTNIKVLDLATSNEDAEKKLVYYGKEFIEIENGKKHLEKCLKEFGSDLKKESDGYYLVKNTKKIELYKKSTNIEEFKSWLSTIQQINHIVEAIGYYTYVDFDSRLLAQYSQTRSEPIKQVTKTTLQAGINSDDNSYSGVISLMKESGFKPNKDCKFKFPIKRKSQDNIVVENTVLYNNFVEPSKESSQEDIIIEDIEEVPTPPSIESDEEIEESPYLVDYQYPMGENDTFSDCNSADFEVDCTNIEYSDSQSEDSQSVDYRYDLLANNLYLKEDNYDTEDYDIDSEELNRFVSNTSKLYERSPFAQAMLREQLVEENLLDDFASKKKESYSDMKVVSIRKKLHMD
jgi:hypothetical protein